MSCSYKGLQFHSVLLSVISFYPHTKWQIFIEEVVFFLGEPPGSFGSTVVCQALLKVNQKDTFSAHQALLGKRDKKTTNAKYVIAVLQKASTNKKKKGEKVFLLIYFSSWWTCSQRNNVDKHHPRTLIARGPVLASTLRGFPHLMLTAAGQHWFCYQLLFHQRRNLSTE